MSCSRTVLTVKLTAAIFGAAAIDWNGVFLIEAGRNGRLVDLPVVDQARRTLNQAGE